MKRFATLWRLRPLLLLFPSSSLVVVALSMSVHQSFLLAPGSDPSYLLHLHSVKFPRALPVILTMSSYPPPRPPPPHPKEGLLDNKHSLFTSPQLRSGTQPVLNKYVYYYYWHRNLLGTYYVAGAESVRNVVTDCPQTALREGVVSFSPRLWKPRVCRLLVSVSSGGSNAVPQMGDLNSRPFLPQFWRLEV